jgi:nucleoside-diphosphate-sugar epimerase
VYLSSIKVFGDHDRHTAFSLQDLPLPTDVYGRSKLLGERLLEEAAGPMRVSIVRPPLVYGPEVRANFLRLMQWVDRELPLPLGSVRNCRSLVALDNLCDFLVRTAEHPRTGTWLVTDGEDVSTPDLIRDIARAMEKRVRLLPVPPSLLRLAGGLVGRRADVLRLCGSLTLDSRTSCAALEWKPPLAREQGIALTVRWYRGLHHTNPV